MAQARERKTYRKSQRAINGEYSQVSCVVCFLTVTSLEKHEVGENVTHNEKYGLRNNTRIDLSDRSVV